MIQRSSIRGLYVITDTNASSQLNLISQVEQALKGGAKVVQYRDKQSPYTEQLLIAQQLKQLCQSYQACFIINDNIGLAQAVQADGVHIGKDDEQIEHARNVLGQEAIIGVSCYNEVARAKQMQALGADYVAFGRFFPSKTKPNAPQADLSTLILAKQQLNIPVVAIGGIDITNAPLLLQTGVDALAVIQGVFNQSDIQAAAHNLSQQIAVNCKPVVS